tara:strand:+ start:3953 stop:4195 length:243 start_codon:yes stop_codon:yes gene_type:complete
LETWYKNLIVNAFVKAKSAKTVVYVKNVFGNLFTKKVPSLVREVLTKIQKRLPLTSDNLLIMESKLGQYKQTKQQTNKEK